MATTNLFQMVDAVSVSVPDLNAGLRFCRDSLGHQLRWRHDDISQAGLALPGGDTEIVLTTLCEYEPNWLVASADYAATAVWAADGRVVSEPRRAGLPWDPGGPWWLSRLVLAADDGVCAGKIVTGAESDG